MNNICIQNLYEYSTETYAICVLFISHLYVYEYTRDEYMNMTDDMNGYVWLFIPVHVFIVTYDSSTT